MNAYKLNGMVGHMARSAICDGLGISHLDIYKSLSCVDHNNVIHAKDGRKFELKLIEIKENE